MSYTVAEFAQEVSYHFQRFTTGFEAKAAIGFAGGALLTYLYIDWLVILFWLLLNATDLCLGVRLAYRNNNFQRRRVYGWIIKTFTHLHTMFFFGVFAFFIVRIYGDAVDPDTLSRFARWFVNGFILMFATTEALSIVDTAEKLGYPIHPIVRKILRWFPRYLEKKAEDITGVPLDENKPSNRSRPHAGRSNYGDDDEKDD